MQISTDLRRQGISFSGYTISTALAQLMVMVFSLLLARYFGPEISGGYTSTFAIASLTAIAFNLGLDTWLLRAGALAQDIRKTFGKILMTKAAAGTVWALLLFGIATKLRPDLYSPTLLAVCVLDVWFDSVFFNLVGSFQHRAKYHAVLAADPTLARVQADWIDCPNPGWESKPAIVRWMEGIVLSNFCNYRSDHSATQIG